MIYGPDGAWLCDPLPETEEGVPYADFDLSFIGVAKAAYDPVGHYSRPDVVRLMFNQKPSLRVQGFDPDYKREPMKVNRPEGDELDTIQP